MALTMKERFARLDANDLPEDIKKQFQVIYEQTDAFGDEDLNEVFAKNFDDLYALVEQKHSGAIRKGQKITKVKPARVKVVKPAKAKKEKEKPKHKGYNGLISEATGVTDSDKLEEIEEIMRHEIFHSTLDWQTKEEFDKGAKEAHELLKAWGSYPTSKNISEATSKMRNKLSDKDIEFIEDQLINNAESTDEEMEAHFVSELGITEAQAKRWVAKRDAYLRRSVEKNIKYSVRTKLKKEARKSRNKDIIRTRDGYEFNRKDPKNKGLKFYDENGKQWECVRWEEKLDECIMKDKDGKEISGCLKDMYVKNPVEKREKGNLVDDCKETLKEAGFTLREHKAGTKKIRRKEPRPEKDIIKEKVGNTFTTIVKDISSSEEKKKENKAVIDSLGRIEKLIVKFMNRLNNLAEDNKADAINKIEKLLKELVD
jgi:hypothetical protein